MNVNHKYKVGDKVLVKLIFPQYNEEFRLLPSKDSKDYDLAVGTIEQIVEENLDYFIKLEEKWDWAVQNSIFVFEENIIMILDSVNV